MSNDEGGLGTGDHQVSIERWLEVAVGRGVFVHQVQTGLGHRQDMLEQAAGERVKVFRGRRHLLELLAVA